MFKTFTAKLGTMRKADEYVVYPLSTDGKRVTIQGDRTCAVIDINTGKGLLCTKGNAITYQLPVYGKPFICDAETLQKALACVSPKEVTLFS